MSSTRLVPKRSLSLSKGPKRSLSLSKGSLSLSKRSLSLSKGPLSLPKLSLSLSKGLVGLALVILALLGCAAPALEPQGVATSVPPRVSPPTGTAPPPRSGPAPIPAAAKVTVTSVTIRAIDVRATRLEKLSLLDDGSLASPEDPDRAGWYVDGTVPGEVGPAVIAGHVDSKTGPAVFFALDRLRRGDQITVGLSTGDKTTFEVDRLLTTAKNGFPTDDVFGPTPDAQLRLITCGGPYEKSVGYRDNTVIFATAVS